MNSLQRPKKITMLGSDGHEYLFLCKPKDDLRKDCRMMEFNTMINKLLKKNPDARRRNLRAQISRSLLGRLTMTSGIRTYAVVPLNEECGLIEWVPNTTGLRPVLNQLYADQGITVSVSYSLALHIIDPGPLALQSKQLREMWGRTDISQLQRYREVLQLFPPLFYKWFLKTFPEPSSWFDARLAYARSAAVMSMVGFIVGYAGNFFSNTLYKLTPIETG
jgi:serine/threonine-protein kinase ATR